MVASTVGALVVAGIVASLTFFAKTTYQMKDRYEIAAQSRALLNAFSKDFYSATTLTWLSSDSLRITQSAGSATYTYSSSTGAITYTPIAGNARVVLSGLSAFQFTPYDASGNAISLAGNLTTASSSTRFVSLAGTVTRGSARSVRTRETLASPRYTLRNR